MNTPEPQADVERKESYAVLQKPIKYIPHPDFQNPALEGEIVRTLVRPPTDITSKLPRDIPPYFASLYATPLLEKEEEVHLFRQMNFFRFKADQLRLATLTLGKVAEAIVPQIACEIKGQLDKAIVARNTITEANMRLVVNHAKKIIDPLHHDFFEVISKGNLALMEATGTYDCNQGNKFSTYATWALRTRIKGFDRKQLRHASNMQFEEDPTILEDTPAWVTSERVLLTYRESIRVYLQKLLSGLEGRLQNIIIDRFGLNHELNYGLEHPLEPLTLKECGARYGVTKERARQLEEEALEHLHRIARCTNYE
ncbi:MAG TPA: sigma-70 family RNA polymerase sigma factor, partial [Candidatus Nanoarchaeia archaeon]|nr:sigma-70 family RNA polymerase sigma factor [Candidatus Nanoarchaeia archaeon]